MYLESRDQKYDATGLFWSLVIGRAAAKGSLTPFTHTFIVPVRGLTNEIYLPSGEIWAPAYSGLPKSTSRSISGGICAAAVPTAAQVSRAIARRVFIIVPEERGLVLEKQYGY